jgi:membrane-associated phospholipid phosphatase
MNASAATMRPAVSASDRSAFATPIHAHLWAKDTRMPAIGSRVMRSQGARRGVMVSDYAARWIFLGGCALVIGLWLFALGVAVPFAPILHKLPFPGVLLVLWAVLYCVPRYRVPMAGCADLCLSGIQLCFILLVLIPLPCLAATIGFPLLDARLAQLDAMLGFDWDTAARWVSERPLIDLVLQIAYNTMPFQAGVVLLIGSIRRPGERNSEFMWLFMVSMLITCAIFAFTPALGKIGHMGTRYVEMLTELRSGGWLVMDYEHPEGIVTFPSFHTTVAIILTYLVRRERWALAIFAPLNILMILSTPTVGGHYLVDVFGGAAVAWVSIIIVGALRRRLASRGAVGTSISTRLASPLAIGASPNHLVRAKSKSA